jgi:ribosome-binding protein aMBF1 (putative translation factor)
MASENQHSSVWTEECRCHDCDGVHAKAVKRSLGREIRARRKQRGLTQELLAPMTGVHVNLLGRIERGTANPTFERLLAIARGLDVSLGQMILAAEKGSRG